MCSAGGAGFSTNQYDGSLITNIFNMFQKPLLDQREKTECLKIACADYVFMIFMSGSRSKIIVQHHTQHSE